MARKKSLTLGWMVSLAFILIVIPFGVESGASPAKVTLKLVSFLPKDQEFSFGIGWFVERVKTESNGEMVINYVGGPEAIPPSEQPEAARTGVADIVVIPSTYYEHLLPAARCFHLTLLRPWEEREPSSGFYDYMVKAHEKIDLFYLGRAMSEWGMQLWTNFEVTNLQEDFKGHKVALTSASTEEFMRRLGFSVVMVPTMDLFTSVERGVVDAWTWPVSAWFFGLHEVTKYAIDIRFGTAENVVYVMNLDKWNKLSKQQQELLVEVMKSVERDGLPRDQKLYVDFRKKFEDAGTQFVKFSPEDTKWFLDLYYTAEWEEAAKKTGQDAADLLREMVAKK